MELKFLIRREMDITYNLRELRRESPDRQVRTGEITALAKRLISAFETLNGRLGVALPGLLTYRNYTLINGGCFKLQNWE